MKRSKFLENCVPSAKDVTARSVTSCAETVSAASAKGAAANIVFVAMQAPPQAATVAAAEKKTIGRNGPAQSIPVRRAISVPQPSPAPPSCPAVRFAEIQDNRSASAARGNRHKASAP